ncbi:MAG: tetratricopeptide repeat protein [Leptolyngbyaceae cyanobacterium bins.302]|nr:tetratricopeptide repeat protein [Leptolyngbyaceae cyanobacterium bins.302]
MNYLFQWLGIISVVGIVSPSSAATVSASRNLSDSFQIDSSALFAQDTFEFEYENYDFWTEQCSLLSEEREYEHALSACEKAISIEPDAENTDIWMGRSSALFYLGRYAESLISFNQVVRASPNYSLAIAYQCASHFQLGHYTDAVDICEQALRIDGNWGNRSPSLAWYYRGLSLRELGRLETALGSFRQALLNNPEDPLAMAECLETASELGFLDEISANCRVGEPVADEQAPQRVMSHRQALEETVRAYERALAANPDDATLWYQQGLALEQLGLYERAVTSYNRAVELAPESSINLARRCGMLNQLQNYEVALESCEAAFQRDERWDEFGLAYAWNQHSVSLLGLGRYEEAIASADRAIALSPNYAPAYTSKSIGLWQLMQYSEANTAIDRAIITYVLIYLKNKSIPNETEQPVEEDETEQTIDEIRRVYGELTKYLSVEVNSNGSANNLINESVLIYQRSQSIPNITFEPEYPEPQILLSRGLILALFNRGRILASQQKYSEANQAYTQALNVFGADCNGNTSPIDSLTLIDNFLNQSKICNGGMRSINDSTLSNILVNQGVNYSHLQALEQASKFAQRATALDPNSFEGWYNWGLILMQLENYTQAKQAFERAIRLKSDDINAQIGLSIASGMVQGVESQREGKLEEAIAAYDRVLNINPNYAPAHERRQALLNLEPCTPHCPTP